MNVRVSLDRYLRTKNVSAYRLAQETAGRVARGSVFALARGERVKRVDLETLGEVMDALERITGHPVTPNDLLEVAPTKDQHLTAAGVPYTGDAETDAVLNDYPDILERIAMLKTGKSKLLSWDQVKTDLGLESQKPRQKRSAKKTA
jgi:DNA-binding Xre family transcriptional regulator